MTATPGLESARMVIMDLVRDIVEGNDTTKSVEAADQWLTMLERVLPFPALRLGSR